MLLHVVSKETHVCGYLPSQKELKQQLLLYMLLLHTVLKDLHARSNIELDCQLNSVWYHIKCMPLKQSATWLLTSNGSNAMPLHAVSKETHVCGYLPSQRSKSGRSSYQQ